eukprot:COSAG02_NODE_163_length_32424_cov_21.759010_6_plen_108_part_00
MRLQVLPQVVLQVRFYTRGMSCLGATPNCASISPFVAVSAFDSGNRHKRRQAAPGWRQSALGGGANLRWAVAPICAMYTGNRCSTHLRFDGSAVRGGACAKKVGGRG